MLYSHLKIIRYLKDSIKKFQSAKKSYSLTALFLIEYISVL